MMDEWLASLQAIGVTSVSLLVMAVVAQWRGWLYFRPQVRETKIGYERRIKDFEHWLKTVREDGDAWLKTVREDRDARIAELSEERDHWRNAHGLVTETLHTAQAQVDELIQANRTSHQALRSIAKAGEANASRE